MRRLYPWLAIGITALALSGCGSSSDDLSAVKAGSGVPLNPSGKPQNQQQQAYADEMQKTGSAMNASMQKQAAAMAAAKARAGGH